MSKFLAEQFLLPGMPIAPPQKRQRSSYDPGRKPRYSYSQVETAGCMAKYDFKYRQKLDSDKTYNLVAGTVVDTAFNAYYEGNLHLSDTHEQRIAYARAAVAQELEDNPTWLTMGWAKKNGDVRSSYENFMWWLFDAPSPAIEKICYRERGRVSVQVKVELELPQYSIMGYIDCLHEDTGIVSDIKMVTGWGKITELQYALRKQVTLYRMMLKDSMGLDTVGQYELLMARKDPKLVVVPAPDIEFLQDELIREFDEHHKKVSRGDAHRNPSKCFEYNNVCPHFGKCWPELADRVDPEEEAA